MIVHTVLLDLDPAKPAEIDAALDGLRSLVALPGVVSVVRQLQACMRRVIVVDMEA